MANKPRLGLSVCADTSKHLLKNQLVQCSMFNVFFYFFFYGNFVVLRVFESNLAPEKCILKRKKRFFFLFLIQCLKALQFWKTFFGQHILKNQQMVQVPKTAPLNTLRLLVGKKIYYFFYTPHSWKTFLEPYADF